MLLLSVLSKFLSNLVLFILNLSVNFLINVFIDVTNDLRIGDLSGLNNWHWNWGRDWWKGWRVVDLLLLLWDRDWSSVNWHHWSWLHFNNWQ
jgi:hypothetical protein